MSTICYRDRTLAADTQITDHGHILGYTSKLAESKNGPIAGCCGGLASMSLFLHWFRTCRPNDRPPYCKINAATDPDGIIVAEDNDGLPQVWLWGGEAELTPVMMHPKWPFVAIGHGAKFAMGAMFMGASAEEAVTAAASFDIYTGGEVATLRLPSSPPTSSRKP